MSRTAKLILSALALCGIAVLLWWSNLSSSQAPFQLASAVNDALVYSGTSTPLTGDASDNQKTVLSQVNSPQKYVAPENKNGGYEEIKIETIIVNGQFKIAQNQLAQTESSPTTENKELTIEKFKTVISDCINLEPQLEVALSIHKATDLETTLNNIGSQTSDASSLLTVVSNTVANGGEASIQTNRQEIDELKTSASNVQSAMKDINLIVSITE